VIIFDGKDIHANKQLWWKEAWGTGVDTQKNRKKITTCSKETIIHLRLTVMRILMTARCNWLLQHYWNKIFGIHILQCHFMGDG